LPHLPRGAQFAKCAVFTHHYWLFGAYSRRMGDERFPVDTDRTALFTRASPTMEKLKFKKEWNG